MGAREEIGRCRCPLCSSTRAHLRVNQKQLAYVICNACNTQIQARSDRSDELLRALHVPDAPADPAPEPVPAEPVHVRTQDTPPVPPAPRRFGWGVLRND